MKCTILFGAGAEQPLGMSNGEDFARKVIGLDSTEMDSEIAKYYKSRIDSENDWYPNYTKTQWKENDLIKAALQKKYLDEYLDEKSCEKKDYDYKIRCELDRYNGTAEDKYSDEEKHKLLNDYLSYMGVIDSAFYTLINPKVLGPAKFWRVVIAYSRAYLYLVGKMADGNVDYHQILSDWEYAKSIMETYAQKQKQTKSYYSILKRYKNKVNIVTTNYTNLCEKIADIPSKQIAYIHGKFGWFESPKEMVTYDAYSEKIPEGVVFPYIFIQSGLKPIVDARQIREYSKMYNYFKESDTIMILGYRINVDDNHINSIIKSAMLKNKKVIYFNFDNENFAIRKRLRIGETENFIIKQIDNNNCYSEFESALKNI